MLSAKLAAFAAVTLPLVQGQAVSLANLPKCAQSAAASGLASTSCSLTDFQCICSAVPFITALTTAVQQSCSTADQQATLAFAQSLCSKSGVNINVPAVAAADTVASSSAASGPPASSSTSTPTADNSKVVDATAATTVASSPTTVSTAPVSSSASSTSYTSTLIPAATTAPTPSSTSSTTSSYIVYDTKSVIPSATIAPADTSDATPQMSTPTTMTTSSHANTTANMTVAASSPIPYVGAAPVRSRVHGAMMAMLAVVGLFCGL